MKPSRRNTLAAAFLAAAFLAAGISFAGAPLVWAAPAQNAPSAPSAQMQERMQAYQQKRLDRMADRLEIRASQQGAWGAYVKVRKELFAARPTPPAQDADAATLARQRAERAAQMAQKLATLADATAKLQEALTPEQVKTLAEMTRHSGAGHFGGRHGGKGWAGGHGSSHGHGDGPWGGKGGAR